VTRLLDSVNSQAVVGADQVTSDKWDVIPELFEVTARCNSGDVAVEHADAGWVATKIAESEMAMPLTATMGSNL
jgi:hypothetical protein